MTDHDFETYLVLVSKLLRLQGKQRAQIAGELRSHLEERLDDLLSQGVPREQAVRMALEDFGDAAVLAADFVSLSRNRRRRWMMRMTTFSAAAMILAAVAIATFWPGRNAGPGLAAVVAQDPAATPTEEDFKDPAAKPADVTATAADATIEDKLNEFTEISFEETPLKDVVQSIEQQTGITVYLNAKKLEEAGVNVDAPITHSFRRIRWRTYLDLMLAELELVHVNRDDLLVITTPEDAESEPEIRVYDCRDLLSMPESNRSGSGRPMDAANARPSLPAPGIGALPLPAPPAGIVPSSKAGGEVESILPQFGGLGGEAPPQPTTAQPGGLGGVAGGAMSGAMPGTAGGMAGGMGSAMGNGGTQTEHEKQADGLIDIITTNIDPESWDAVGGPGSISAYHGLIVVTQTAQTHKKVERVLDMLREAAGLEVKTGKVVR